ncbi:MAG: CoB--CoM heterodisulfide reductase iron-sulfur subunit A family protein [Desulfitobacteriaceae bacterium]
MRKVGVFVCHCGTNIAGTVDCEAVAKAAAKFPNVAFAMDYKYVCSEPGQKVIQDAIKEHNLDRVVVASCTPRMHEPTFRRCIAGAGLNPYLFEMANIREQCSWVHQDKAKGTWKAIDLVRKAVAKVVKNEPLEKTSIAITKRALVIGGGIAGIQVALDIADAGYPVTIVEKEPSIGGRMSQIDKTFPTIDCSVCILGPKLVDTSQNPLIDIVSYAQVEKVEGYVGNFDVTIRKKARSIDMSKCTGCGLCQEKCPTKVDSEFDMKLGKRKAIYTPFPQAVPNKPVIDRVNCTKFKTGKCGICQKLCPVGAVDFEQQDESISEKFGTIIVSTGFNQYDHSVIGEYGYGKYPDVITGLHLERLINASGPTQGKIKRPSDHKIPETVVFIQCVGSRDEAKGKSYCSRTCCMYTAKHATLVHEKIPGAQTYIFYMDVRTPGKGYEEFYKRTTEEYEANYIRGRVSKVYQRGDKLVVRGEDTLLGRPVEVEADMVVLAVAMEAREDAADLGRILGISTDKDHFFTEAHPKLKPVETHTAGVFLAGACQGPKDIPDSVAQAGAAASKAIGLLSKSQMETEPVVSEVNESRCSGCLMCKGICPYKAIDAKMIQERVGGKLIERQVASVNKSLCHGCGACTVACRAGCLNLLGFTNEQILAEVEAVCL